MNIKWLFEISAEGTTYYWSFYDTTYDGQEYQGRIVSDSFSGMTEARAGDDNGLVNPSDVSFEIATVPAEVQGVDDETGEPVYNTNPFFESQFRDQLGTIKLVVDGTLQRNWSMRVKRCELRYGGAKFWLESLINYYLEGDHPTTKHPREVWPSSDSEKERDDKYVVPQAFGDAYIPLRSVNTGDDRYYVLGKDSYTYNISEVRSPRDWNNQSTWDDTYSYPQTTDSGYKLFQAIIADSNGDGTADAPGLWKSGDSFLDIPTKFTSSEISSGVDANPATVVEAVLKSFGIPDAYIDSTGSFSDAAAQFDSWSMAWNGGFYEQISREKRLANLLFQCNATLRMAGQIELHPRSTASQAAIDNSDIKRESFRYRPTWPKQSDGGYVEYTPTGMPMDRPQELLCWSSPTQTDEDDVDNPESTRMDCRLVNDSQIARKLGVLAYNRKLDKAGTNSFTLVAKTSFLQLRPDQVITLDHDLYGESRNVMIRSITINKDLSLELECVEFTNGIIQFSDLSPTAVTIVDDDTEASYEQPTEMSPLIAIKKNTVDFDTASDGYAYVHGYNKHGEPADKNGQITFDGELVQIERAESGDNWTVSTSQEADSYLMFDTIKSGKFTVETNAHSVAFVKKESNIWYYDNGTKWTEFTVADTDTIIGTLSRGETSIKSANVFSFGRDPGTIRNIDADDIALKNSGWMFDGDFQSDDADTVSWLSGTLTYADGTEYSIDAGNTGDMGSQTYVYFDVNVSETTLQTTTTAADSVGKGKLLVATAAPGTSEATFVVFGAKGQMKVDAFNSIVANSITSGEINTGSISLSEWAGDSDDISEGSSHYFAGASGADFRKSVDDLDDIVNGSSYGKVNINNINTSGYVLLSYASGDADDISEGSSHKFAAESGADVTADNAQSSSWLTDSTDIVFANDSINRLTDLVLDNLSDGTYGKVKATDISSGHIVLSSVEGTIDDLEDGTTYGKVKSTQISAGEILLGEASGDLDDISDGGNYGKVSLTSISGGKIILSGCDGDADDISEGSGNKFAAESGAVKNWSSIYDDGGTLTLASSKLVIDTDAGMESGNFVSGSDGWKLSADGSAEFEDITARGTIYYGDGTLIDDLQPSEPGSDPTEDHAGDIHYRGSTAPASPKSGWYWTDTSVTPNELKYYTGSSWIRIATLGAKFGDNIEGGGSDDNQIGDDGYISSLHAGIIVAGTISTDKLNFGVLDDSNISSGAHKLSTISDDGGTLTISSSKLKISTSDGFEVDTAGGFVVSADGGLRLQDSCGLEFEADGTSEFNLQAYYGSSQNTLFLDPGSSNNNQLLLGASSHELIQMQIYVKGGSGIDFFVDDNGFYKFGENVFRTDSDIEPNNNGTQNFGSSTDAWAIGYIEEIQNPNGDLFISNNHVKITGDAPYYYMEDTGSSNNTIVYLINNGEKFTVQSDNGTLDTLMSIDQSGDLDIGGTLTESAFSLDMTKDDNVWNMLQSVKDAFDNHDGSKLHPKLQRKVEKPNGKQVIGKSPSDISQLLVEAILKLYKGDKNGSVN
jgi:hypothetical protein